MAARAPAFLASELIIDLAGREVLRTALVEERYRLGRGATNELAFPDDVRLSREHLAIERTASGWQVSDLQSSNGTRVNGLRIAEATPLRNGDRVGAGSLTLTFRTPGAAARQETIVAFHADAAAEVSTVSTDLQTALRSGMRPERLNSMHLAALLKAGRELASYRALSELFDVILELSVSAVRALRGVLMTFEAQDVHSLTVRSSRGEQFSISTTVRDRVMAGESLLVQDTMALENLVRSESIVAGNVRSILAVPLQTEHGVFGLIYLDSPNAVRRFGADDLSLLTVMANIAAIRIEHARLLEVEQAEKQLARELDHAAEIQNGLLPARPPICEGLDLAGYNAPCRKVGGDYYDFWTYPDGQVAVVIADVSGKGMPAALLMANLQACAHVLFDSTGSLAERVARLNRAVATNTPISSFITFFAGVIDAKNGTLTYCNAGHNPPVLLRSAGEVVRLGPTGLVLGLLPRAEYREEQCGLEPGDSLLLFSDGVTEACKPRSDEEFGEPRLIEVFKEADGLSAAQAIERIKIQLAAFTDGAPASDDVTLAVVRRG